MGNGRSGRTYMQTQTKLFRPVPNAEFQAEFNAHFDVELAAAAESKSATESASASKASKLPKPSSS